MSLQKLGFCVKIMVFKQRGQSTTCLRLWRSLGCKLTNTTQNMAELASKPKRRGGRYCVAGAPNNQSYIVLPCYNNAPVPNRRSFAGKMDKICTKTSTRLQAGREVHTATLQGILLQISYSAGGDTEESIINKRIRTNAWYNYCKSAFFSVSILILSRDKARLKSKVKRCQICGGTHKFKSAILVSGVQFQKSTLRPRPHVSGYFLIRNVFFPDTAIVHTHTANSQANPEIFESALQSGNFWIR